MEADRPRRRPGAGDGVERHDPRAADCRSLADSLPARASRRGLRGRDPGVSADFRGAEDPRRTYPGCRSPRGGARDGQPRLDPGGDAERAGRRRRRVGAARRAIRRSRAPAFSRLRRRDHPDARPRHRRQHGDLLRRQRDADRAAAVSRLGPSRLRLVGHERGGLSTRPPLGTGARGPAPSHSGVLRFRRDLGEHGDALGRRGAGTGPDRLRDGGFLPHPRRGGEPRTDGARGRRRGRGAHPPVRRALAAALRGRPDDRRPPHPRQRRADDGRRRHAARVSAPSSAGFRRPGRSRGVDSLLAEDDERPAGPAVPPRRRTVEARRHARAGAARSGRRRRRDLARVRRLRRGGPALRHRRAPRRRRPGGAARAAHPLRGCRDPAADHRRQRRGPARGAGRRAAAGDRAAHVARGGPRAVVPAVPRRGPDPRGPRRGRRARGGPRQPRRARRHPSGGFAAHRGFLDRRPRPRLHGGDDARLGRAAVARAARRGLASLAVHRAEAARGPLPVAAARLFRGGADRARRDAPRGGGSRRANVPSLAERGPRLPRRPRPLVPSRAARPPLQLARDVQRLFTGSSGGPSPPCPGSRPPAR